MENELQFLARDERQRQLHQMLQEGVTGKMSMTALRIKRIARLVTHYHEWLNKWALSRITAYTD